jgi:hypothetical protein
MSFSSDAVCESTRELCKRWLARSTDALLRAFSSSKQRFTRMKRAWQQGLEVNKTLRVVGIWLRSWAQNSCGRPRLQSLVRHAAMSIRA